MGKLESESRRRSRRNQLQKVILRTVQVAGLLALAVAAPKVITGMKQLGMLPSGRQSEVIKSATKRMVETGLLEWQGGALRLTKKGEEALRILELKEYKIPRPRRWDKKWRVLIFDIPEKRKNLREHVRRILSMLGFERLQDSVWVYPYDCEEIIQLLKVDFQIGNDLLYMIVDQIERDIHLKSHFKLIR
jgi:CRISPR-associated endonuclease Cas2